MLLLCAEEHLPKSQARKNEREVRERSSSEKKTRVFFDISFLVRRPSSFYLNLFLRENHRKKRSPTSPASAIPLPTAPPEHESLRARSFRLEPPFPGHRPSVWSKSKRGVRSSLRRSLTAPCFRVLLSFSFSLSRCSSTSPESARGDPNRHDSLSLNLF